MNIELILPDQSMDNTITLWKVVDLDYLDGLLVRGCEWLHGYLLHPPTPLQSGNTQYRDADRAVCDDILEEK